jgi:quercetin dioxygenase-like cupin family protein
MAQLHSHSDTVISLQPLGAALRGATTTAILKAPQLELVRIVLHAGKEIKEHKAPGEITLQCLEGVLEFRTHQATHVLRAGQLTHLRAGEPHALKALEDMSALLTIRLSPRSAS